MSWMTQRKGSQNNKSFKKSSMTLTCQPFSFARKARNTRPCQKDKLKASRTSSSFDGAVIQMSRFVAVTFLLCLGISPSSILVTADPKLRWSKSTPHDICEGDCDKDSDCKRGLSCFKRSDKSKVPGCEGSGKSGRDYCYKNNGSSDSSRKRPVKIKHIGTSQTYVTGSDVYKAEIKVPDGTEEGDLLLLVLQRSDDYVPMGIDDDYPGWTRAAECFKSNNGRSCATYLDCKFCTPKKERISSKNLFCEKFHKGGQLGYKTEGTGKDLAQAIFYKEAGRDELRGSKSLKIVMSPRPEREHPAWMFLIALRGADTKDPIRDWNGTGNDGSTHSVFPSVYGRKGDLVLLSQGFDSGAPGVREGDFLPPKGFDDYASMFDCNDPRSRRSRRYKCDESGYLFGKVLYRNGETGSLTTLGHGRWEKSDSLVSLTIMPKGGSKDDKGRGASEWLGTNGKDCPKDKSKPR